jgi:1,4-dihydroxy-2-naphthoate octaprenyltransferase
MNKTWQGVWRLVDPKITLASAASMLLGAALAHRDGAIAWRWLLLTIFGIFCIEAAKNASGEIFDWDSGDDRAVSEEDRSPFSGGKRVLVDDLLTRGQTWAVAIAGYALGAAAGVAIALLCEPRVLWIGVVGLALAFFYHAPPLELAYRGLGELTVAITYGPLVCAGTYLVQRHALPDYVIAASLPLAIAIAAFLFINEFPDRAADEKAGKRTLVVRLGAERASLGFALLELCVWIGVLLLPLTGFPRSFWLGAIGIPLSFAAARRLIRAYTRTREIIPAQGWTLLAFVLLSLGASVGLLIP